MPDSDDFNSDGKLVPEGWVRVRVADLLDLVNGFPFKPSQWRERGLPIIRIQNLNNPRAPFNYFDGDLPEKFRVRENDLLFAWSGTPGTSFGAHIWRGGLAWLNQHIFRVELDEQLLDKEFVKLAINQNLDDYIGQAHGGAGLAHITKKKFESSYLLIPPLPEQRRIAQKVTALLGRVDAARERMAKVPEILKRFRQSVLAAACSGRLTEDWRTEQRVESSWAIKPLRDVIDRLDQGWSPKCEIVPSQSPHEWAVIKTTAVQPMQFVETENKRLPPSLEPREHLELQSNDLLITRAGPRARAGISCLVRAVRPRLMICDKVYRMRVRGSVLPAFLELAMNEPAMMDCIDDLKTGTSDSGVNLTQSKFLDLEISVPTIAEQERIVAKVETLLKYALAAEGRISTVEAALERVSSSILSRAFRGELVPNEAVGAPTTRQTGTHATAT